MERVRQYRADLAERDEREEEDEVLLTIPPAQRIDLTPPHGSPLLGPPDP